MTKTFLGVRFLSKVFYGYTLTATKVFRIRGQENTDLLTQLRRIYTFAEIMDGKFSKIVNCLHHEGHKWRFSEGSLSMLLINQSTKAEIKFCLASIYAAQSFSRFVKFEPQTLICLLEFYETKRHEKRHNYEVRRECEFFYR